MLGIFVLEALETTVVPYVRRRVLFLAHALGFGVYSMVQNMVLYCRVTE